MNLRAALASSVLFCLHAHAAGPPASIANARLEPREGVAPAAVLDQAAREKTASWVGWSVLAIPDAGDACCFTDRFKRRGCSLADREVSWGTSGRPEPKSSTEMYVLVETRDGLPRRVRVVSPECPVDGADRRVIWLGAVDGAASLAALSRLLDSGERDSVQEPALAAVAFHADARADAMIEKRVLDRSLPMEARQQAVFWAGQARGEAGARLIDRVLSSEASGDLRQHAVFALSQSSVPDAPERIKRVAVEDRDAEVRGHAYFSLSQTHAEDAGAWILGRLDAERNDHVREQAVFALSRLEDGTGWLLKLLRSNRDPETTRRALFWLGQSDDPRALAEIEKILDR